MSINAHIRKFIYSVFVFNLLALGFCYGEKRFTVEQIISDTYNQIGLDSKFNNSFKTQTLAYLDRPGLRKTLTDEFEYKMNIIGADFFKDLFNQVLTKEIALKAKYVVFYHGQQRQFMALQDIYQDLFECVYKKAIKDFVMIRVPDAAFGKYDNIQQFLKKNIESGLITRWDFDEIPKIRKRLLSVNPCLFGNSRYLGECSFYYFINSSNASGVDIGRLIYKNFEFFGLQDFYNKHKTEVDEMVSLLSAYETDQTGILMQIFIPRTLVDQFAYRCQPWGRLHYGDPEKHPALKDLDAYQNKADEAFALDYDLDSVQFRVLMNTTLLDPTKGVKFFRYGKETANVKKYKDLRSKLSKKLADFVKAKKAS